MINRELDETKFVEHNTTTGIAMSLLRGVWRAFLDGAAMYGAAFHGYPIFDDLKSDAAGEADNQRTVYGLATAQNSDRSRSRRIERRYQRSVP